MSDVVGYCLAHVGRPFCWGRADCAVFARDWAVLAHGICADVPLPLARPSLRARPRPASAIARLTRRFGAKAGLREVQGPPRQGDIGILEGLNEGAGFGIYTGASWAVRAPAGFALLDAPAVYLFRGA